MGLLPANGSYHGMRINILFVGTRWKCDGGSEARSREVHVYLRNRVYLPLEISPSVIAPFVLFSPSLS